jgi:AcrR family transcriptional regulator
MPYPSKLSLDAITEAAVAITVTGGISALGIRPVADALSVRPTALYRYCADVDGLVSLVAEHSATELRAAAQRQIAATPPDGRTSSWELVAMATAYRHYAVQQPGLYAALVTDTTRSGWANQQGSARKALWELLLQVVGRLTEHPDDTGAAVAVWSFLHGFVHLHAARLFGASGPRDGFERGVAALANGLRASATIAAPRRERHPPVNPVAEAPRP